jgi:hypothetical protein
MKRRFQKKRKVARFGDEKKSKLNWTINQSRKVESKKFGEEKERCLMIIPDPDKCCHRHYREPSLRIGDPGN